MILGSGAQTTQRQPQPTTRLRVSLFLPSIRCYSYYTHNSLPSLCALIHLQRQILDTLHTTPITLLCPVLTFSRQTYSNSLLLDLHLCIRDLSTKISTTSPKKMWPALGLFSPC